MTPEVVDDAEAPPTDSENQGQKDRDYAPVHLHQKPFSIDDKDLHRRSPFLELAGAHR